MDFTVYVQSADCVGVGSSTEAIDRRIDNLEIMLMRVEAQDVDLTQLA